MNELLGDLRFASVCVCGVFKDILFPEVFIFLYGQSAEEGREFKEDSTDLHKVP